MQIQEQGRDGEETLFFAGSFHLMIQGWCYLYIAATIHALSGSFYHGIHLYEYL